MSCKSVRVVFEFTWRARVHVSSTGARVVHECPCRAQFLNETNDNSKFNKNITE